MDYFNYQQGQLFAEKVPVAEIAAQYGTPCFVYSRATLERHWHAFDNALGAQPHLICYAVKANSNLAVLNLLARLGSGFDIVSVGELERVLAAGGDPKKIVFSGVGKRVAEMQRALEVGILCFNIESAQELQTLNQIAGKLNKTAPVSIRINPDVDIDSHPYIVTGLKENKFGVEIAEAKQLYLEATKLPNLEVIGMDCHIGSQITELDPYLDALDRLLILLDDLQNQSITISHLDLGGGLGVRYHDETPPLPAELSAAIASKLQGRDITVILEPGRAIAANAGILVTRVDYLKSNDMKNFAIVDAAMNDLLRPALYQAWHTIIPVNEKSASEVKAYDIVGAVCETGDFLGKERQLALAVGDLLAIRTAGAYGFVMSSNYNTRPRAAELLVDGEQVHEVRRRETITELFAHEMVVPT